jgi:hypothetical protein
MLPPFLRVCNRSIFVYFNGARRTYGNAALAAQAFVITDNRLAVYDTEYLRGAGIDTFSAAGAEFFVHSHNVHRNSLLNNLY